MRRLFVLVALIGLSCSSPEKKVEEPFCTPGTLQCGGDGTSIETCADDGMSWTVTATCAAGASCIDLACQCPTRQVLGADGCLTPGIETCAEGFLQGELQCNAQTATCGAGEVQVVGKCVKVGLTGCPENGWQVDEESGGCKVPMEECSDNEDWVIGEGCVANGLSKPCGNPDLPYGEETVDGTVIYVWSNSMQPTEDGSQANPYKSLAAAVDAASAGTTIRVGAGEYEGGILIEKSLRIIGKCAESVTIKGGAEFLPPDSEISGRFAIYVDGAVNVELAGFTVADPDNVIEERASGIFLEQADGSVIRDVRFDGLSGAAIDLHGCSDVLVEHIEVVEQTLVQGLSPYVQAGYGIYVVAGSGNTITASRFTKTKGADIKAENTCPTITYNHFELRGDLGGLPPMGVWVDVCPSGTTLIEANTFTRKMTHAVLFEQGAISVLRNVISGTVTDYDDLNGPALKVTAADFTIAENLFLENQYAAINAVESEGTIEGNRIDSGLPSDPGLKNGDGIILKDCDPGPVTIKDNTIVSNTRNGVLATGTITAISNNVINDTQLSPAANALYGSAINVVDGSDATIKGNALSGNVRLAIRFDNAYGKVEGNVIADTIADDDGRCGGGLVVGGAKSSYLQAGVLDNLFVNNYCAGLYVENSNIGTVDGNIFMGTKGKNGSLGTGAVVWESNVDLSRNWFVDNDDTGLVFHASNGAISDNLFEGNGTAGKGVGLVVQEMPNPAVQVDHNTFRNNGLVGALVRGSLVEFRRNALVSNAANADGIGGAGAWFEARTDGQVRANYLSENKLAGLVAYDVADLTFSVNYISSTQVGSLPSGDSPVQLADGIVAAQQSFVSLLYNSALANKNSGLVAFDSEGIVKGNTLLSNGGYGLELANSQMTIDVNLFRSNVQGETTEDGKRSGPPAELGAWEPCIME